MQVIPQETTRFSFQSLQLDHDQIVIAIICIGIALLLSFLFGYLIRSLSSQKQVAAEREQLIKAQALIKQQELLDEERDTALELARERLENAFHDLADESLIKNNQQFLQLASQKLETQQRLVNSDLDKRQQAINHLLKPINSALEKTESQISKIEKERQHSFGQLTQQLVDMRSTQHELKSETRNLVNALRRPEVRGRWGEQTLRRLVELAGMVAHCDFDEQITFSDGDSPRLRPDMMISLPDNRALILDAKTPLQAYLDALESSDDETRNKHLQQHVANVKKHIRQLSGKEYWNALPQTPEFVVMFIPGEQFLSAALDLENDLFDQAMQQKVILASPNNLIALLKTVAYGWKQVELAKNAENIRKIAEDLYKRLKVLSAAIKPITMLLVH